MAIRWDSVLVRALARELDTRFSGARLRALRLDGASRDLALFFREHTLLWRLHPERGYLRVDAAREPAPTDLRVRARVLGVSAPPDERLLRWELRAERGRRGTLEIVVELLGNRLNAVATEGERATIRHVLLRREGGRPFVVGQRYRAPPPTGRVDRAGERGWAEALGPVPPPDRPRELVRRFAWTSTLNAATILGDAADEWAPEALSAAYGRWRGIAAGEPTEAVLISSESGLQPYPLPLVGVRARPAASLLEAFEGCFEDERSRGELPAALDVPPDTLRALDRAVRNRRRRLERLLGELEQLEDPARLRAVGDLILTRYGEIGTGASEVTVRDFGGAETRIALDPSLAPHENADRYYTRAARAGRAAARLPGLVEEARRELERLEEVRDRAVAGEADPEEIGRALPEAAAERPKGASGPVLPYRIYRSSGGLEIRVGRGARHNDDLTFRHSAPGDVWLHARDSAGAHVVLRWPGPGAPPARDLEEAAVLAALHSRARTSGSVPVDWTYRKYVRKPKGAAPGSVAPDRIKTVFVEPDESLGEELARRGRAG